MDDRIKETAEKAAVEGVFFGGSGIGELVDVNERFDTLHVTSAHPVHFGIWLGSSCWEVHVVGQTDPHRGLLKEGGFHWNLINWERRFPFHDEESCVDAFRAACDVAIQTKKLIWEKMKGGEQ